jgi:hypothetical protein
LVHLGDETLKDILILVFDDLLCNFRVFLYVLDEGLQVLMLLVSNILLLFRWFLLSLGPLLGLLIFNDCLYSCTSFIYFHVQVLELPIPLSILSSVLRESLPHKHEIWNVLLGPLHLLTDLFIDVQSIKVIT